MRKKIKRSRSPTIELVCHRLMALPRMVCETTVCVIARAVRRGVRYEARSVLYFDNRTRSKASFGRLARRAAASHLHDHLKPAERPDVQCAIKNHAVNDTPLPCEITRGRLWWLSWTWNRSLVVVVGGRGGSWWRETARCGKATGGGLFLYAGLPSRFKSNCTLKMSTLGCRRSCREQKKTWIILKERDLMMRKQLIHINFTLTKKHLK